MKIVLKFLPVLILIALIAAGVYSLILSNTYFDTAQIVNENIEEAASIIGSQNGKLIGTFNGTYNGITQGWAQGAKAGKKDGQSGEDTTVKIKGRITAVGKLDVLHVSTNQYTIHKYGDKYVELQKNHANVVYNVDLSKISVEMNDDQLIVQIPLPKTDVSIDLDQTESIAREEIAMFFNGKTEDGVEARINSWNQEQKKLEEQFQNHDSAEYQKAKELAITHVEQLVQSIRINSETVSVKVVYQEEQGANAS